MDGCSIELLCGAEFFKIRMTLYFVISCGIGYVLGRESGRQKNYREGFINGVQYYLNIVVYNAAKIPEKIDEDANACIKEAKKRLEKHIAPKPPNYS